MATTCLGNLSGPGVVYAPDMGRIRNYLAAMNALQFFCFLFFFGQNKRS